MLKAVLVPSGRCITMKAEGLKAALMWTRTGPEPLDSAGPQTTDNPIRDTHPVQSPEPNSWVQPDMDGSMTLRARVSRSGSALWAGSGLCRLSWSRGTGPNSVGSPPVQRAGLVLLLWTGSGEVRVSRSVEDLNCAPVSLVAPPPSVCDWWRLRASVCGSDEGSDEGSDRTLRPSDTMGK